LAVAVAQQVLFVLRTARSLASNVAVAPSS
jgi:hypothetical protein